MDKLWGQGHWDRYAAPNVVAVTSIALLLNLQIKITFAYADVTVSRITSNGENSPKARYTNALSHKQISARYVGY